MIEKLDIIDQAVYCYDEQFNLVKSLELNQFQGVDFSYLQGAKLFTLNVSQPIKRVVKFSEINGLNTNAEFVEYPYSDMTAEQQAAFDNFIEQAENA